MSQGMETTLVSSPFRWAAAGQALASGIESGDHYIFTPFPGGALAAVADGLGHGANAAIAAKTAMSTLASHAHEPATQLVQRCHEALRKTRGAVLSLASFAEPPAGNPDPIWTMTWVGVGNVKGVLLRAAASAFKGEHEWLTPRGGIVGYQLPTPRPVTIPVGCGDTLIFVTDGIHSDFIQGLTPDVFQAGPDIKSIADQILTRSRRGSDDALVLVVQKT